MNNNLYLYISKNIQDRYYQLSFSTNKTISIYNNNEIFKKILKIFEEYCNLLKNISDIDNENINKLIKEKKQYLIEHKILLDNNYDINFKLHGITPTITESYIRFEVYQIWEDKHIKLLDFKRDGCYEDSRIPNERHYSKNYNGKF